MRKYFQYYCYHKYYKRKAKKKCAIQFKNFIIRIFVVLLVKPYTSLLFAETLKDSNNLPKKEATSRTHPNCNVAVVIVILWLMIILDDFRGHFLMLHTLNCKNMLINK